MTKAETPNMSDLRRLLATWQAAGLDPNVIASSLGSAADRMAQLEAERDELVDDREKRREIDRRLVAGELSLFDAILAQRVFMEKGELINRMDAARRALAGRAVQELKELGES